MAEPAKWSPLALGAIVTLVMGVAGSATLFPVMGTMGGRELYTMLLGVGINAWVVGYAVGALRYARAALLRDVAALAPFMRGNRPGHVMPDQRWVHAVTLAGMVFGFLIASAGMHLFDDEERVWPYAWTLLLLPTLWAAVLRAIFIVTVNSIAVFRLGRDGLDIDISERRALQVFARIGARHVSLILIGLTVIPLQEILTGGLDYWGFVPALVVTLPAALAMLGAAIGGVHLGIVDAKRAELDRIEATERSAGADPQLAMVAFLYRREVERTPEWPVSISGVAQILLYVLIPPAAWTAAALVENLISAFLG